MKNNDSFHSIILDSIADGVFTVDCDWNITSFNSAAEKITGISRTQAVGQKCFDVFRADVCQTACSLRHSMDTGEDLRGVRVNLIRIDGEHIPVSISTAVLRGKNGKIEGGVETFRDLSAIELLRREIEGRFSTCDIISKNHQIRRMLDILPDIAESDSTVLVEGPSGSGKELVARAIHDLSFRKENRFVAVNCGALPDNLLESELFGYLRGAFTDARRDKPGRFALAEGGTIFLDEIADISPAMQVKLLRVLQEREYEPLGSVQPVKANVRVVAASNRDLNTLRDEGTFREDLFYRLNVLRLKLPPLSERREDIPLLADHFIRHFNAEKGKDIEGLSAGALEELMKYHFPGNVRELQNIIERAFVLCKTPLIEKGCLPPEVLGLSAAPASFGCEPETGSLGRAEASAIIDALARHGGNRDLTAAELGIHKTTLWRKMKRLGVSFP